MVKEAKTKPKIRSKELSKEDTKQKAKAEAAKQAPIPSSFALTRQVFVLLRTHWKVLSGIVLVYALLNLVFASGILSDLNSSIATARQSHSLSSAFSGYGSLVTLGSSTGNAQAGSSAVQSFLLVLESLVVIWALRQLIAGEKITIKQAYYQSMTPLIPFLLVAAVIIVQLLPVTLGTALIGVTVSVVGGGSGALAVIFALFFVLFAAWTIYMISASIFSMYIVTLPDMQPRAALRSAKKLVHYRRWPILRRLFFLPLFILVALGIITIPFILLLPFLVAPLFFALLMITILFAHAYLYSLYRGLIA